MDKILKLNAAQRNQVWKIKFEGEVGIDAGGLTREWFELCSKEVFNVDYGLWWWWMFLKSTPVLKYLR